MLDSEGKREGQGEAGRKCVSHDVCARVRVCWRACARARKCTYACPHSSVFANNVAHGAARAFLTGLTGVRG